MVKTGGGGRETSHAFSPPMQTIHRTSEKCKAHGKDVVVVVVAAAAVVPAAVVVVHYLPNNSLSSVGDITSTTTDGPRVFSTDADYTLHEREAQGSW
jgi:hypothetical protein